MSIAFGAEATSANFNSSFLSRNSDTDTTGKVDLLNTDTDSGPTIANLQAKVNGQTFVNHATQSIAGSGEISMTSVQQTLGMQQRKLQSTGGDANLSITPFGSGGGWVDGATMRLMGVDDTNSLNLIHNDNDYGCILNGNFKLQRFSTIVIYWDESLLRWIEQCRNS